LYQIYNGVCRKKSLDKIKLQVRASFNRHFEYSNELAYVVAEYNNRMRLKELGFVDSMENLDTLTAEYFIAIAIEKSKLEADKMDSMRK
jgi:hypothetical protein